MKFMSEHAEMSGELLLPCNYQRGTKLPTILIVGPWLNVMQQVQTNYALRLVKKGFAAFIFDFRHWGQSAGLPREYESPTHKIADIHSALRFLAELPEVDAVRIGVLGVCFGVGYVAAAASDPLIKSIATVAAWVHDVPSITALVGDEEIARRRKAGKAAMAAFKQDATVAYVPAGSSTDKTAAMYSPDPNFYYNTDRRGVVPEWTNRFAVLGWEEWLDFDGVSKATHITQPLLVIHSDNSALPDNAKRFFNLAKGPKELLWMEGEHTQFYDTAPQIDQAINAIAAHFGRTLLSIEAARRTSAAAIAGTHEFFAALEASDIPRFLNVWDDQGVQVMPYAPPGFPSRLEGKAAIEKQYGPLPTAFDGMSFPVQTLRATTDPNTVIAEFRGSIKLKSGGRYDNQYVGVFAFNDRGKLAQYTEYFNPFVLLSGFPGAAQMGPDGPRSLVEQLPQLADKRDWRTLQTLFTEEVLLDYTSLEGGQPKTLTARELVATWKQNLSRFAATKHDFSAPKITIQGSKATATFSGQATHLREENGASSSRWSCGGDYEVAFEHLPNGWRISAMRFAATWQQGRP